MVNDIALRLGKGIIGAGLVGLTYSCGIVDAVAISQTCKDMVENYNNLRPVVDSSAVYGMYLSSAFTALTVGTAVTAAKNFKEALLPNYN